jgi:alkyldihydroxyacetonephosphate synthase
MFAGQGLPAFMPFLKKSLSVDVAFETPKQPESAYIIEAPSVNAAFVEELGVLNVSRRSFSKAERVLHSHGHTFQEIHALRNYALQRHVDMVVYPLTTEHCENLVSLANKHDVVLVPYGGGTNVT